MLIASYPDAPVVMNQSYQRRRSNHSQSCLPSHNRSSFRREYFRPWESDTSTPPSENFDSDSSNHKNVDDMKLPTTPPLQHFKVQQPSELLGDNNSPCELMERQRRGIKTTSSEGQVSDGDAISISSDSSSSVAQRSRYLEQRQSFRSYIKKCTNRRKVREAEDVNRRLALVNENRGLSIRLNELDKTIDGLRRELELAQTSDNNNNNNLKRNVQH